MNRYNHYAVLFTVVLFVAADSGCTGQSKPPVKAPDAHGEHGAHGSTTAFEQTTQLIVSSTPERPRAGESVELKFMLHDAAGQMLKEFEPTHEKLAHLIIVREALDEFAHLHPTVEKTGTMTTTHTFPSGGNYLVFLDYKPAGKSAATARAKLVVEGDSPPAPALEPNVPGTLKGVGLQAELPCVRLRTRPRS